MEEFLEYIRDYPPEQQQSLLAEFRALTGDSGANGHGESATSSPSATSQSNPHPSSSYVVLSLLAEFFCFLSVFPPRHHWNSDPAGRPCVIVCLMYIYTYVCVR